jgi:hypothetical protein
MPQRPFTLDECKIQAAILLKNIRTDKNIDSTILDLLKQFPLFAAENTIGIIAKIKLKHTLVLIANQYGFASWNNLKVYFEKTGNTSFVMHSGFLNHWFANYKEAKAYLDAHPQDFLLPYKHQFVVCDNNAILHMGFNPDDVNWQQIQHNWVEPSDMAAWNILNQFLLRSAK